MRDVPPPRPQYAPGTEVAARLPEVSAAASAPGPAGVTTLRFTGDGAEYFRIWIVNLLLTLVTLGVYSAWAKVRKTRYFWQNTRLDGHAFDYHGRPLAILLGRVVALVLVVAYSLAFDISRTAGLVVVVALCVAGPWLFMRAQRFKLVNSSWRGLRFGFDDSVATAYRVVLPPLVIWFSSTIVAAVASGSLTGFGAAGTASALLLPWMHHRLKRYQHERARYGDREFSFLPATPAFYGVYLKAGLLACCGVVVAMFAGPFLLGGVFAGGRSSAAALAAFVTGGLLVLVVYLCAWPYFAARLQAIVWSHTRLGDVRFATSIAAWPLVKLVAKNVLLTLVTAGLYWPFASVALARYRVECMRAESEEPIDALVEATRAAPGFAAGDAALDAFGLDIGL